MLGNGMARHVAAKELTANKGTLRLTPDLTAFAGNAVDTILIARLVQLAHFNKGAADRATFA
jgi:hypothetical protein